MATKRPRRSEFTKFMANHILSDVNRYVAAAVIYSDGMADHLREYRAGTRPGTDDLTALRII
jgi:hypothetical protein